MERRPVSSSNLKSVGYDAATRVLEIEIQHGGVYQYLDVPQSEYDGLMQASSHGRYFIGNIMDFYPTIRLRRRRR